MKVILTSFFCSILLALAGQNTPAAPFTPGTGKKLQVVDAACGQCKLGLPGKSCDLAVLINGKAYFVDGTDIDSHGDAHAKDGFCEAIRKAEVQGELINNRFKASYFKLVNDSTGKNKQ